MTDVAQSRAVSLPRGRDLLPLVREGAISALFVAMAFSISLTQLLLALLVVLAFPWPDARRRHSTPHPLADAARAAWARAEPLRRHPLTRPFLLFVTVTLLSALLSGNPGWSLWIARDTLRITVFYLALWYTHDAAHALRLWQGFLAALALMACYGLAQAYLCGGGHAVLMSSETWLDHICLHSARVRGPFSIYMTFGGVLLVGSLFVMAYLANAPWRRVWWMAPTGLVMVTALAFTYSRNAWLGLAVGALALIVTARRAVRISLLLLGVVVVVAAVTPSTVAYRARSIVDLHDKTIRDRLAMWRSGLAMIRDHPLLGVGPGEVRAWYGQYRRPEAIRPSTGHLHNSAIQIGAERGLPALAVWIWLWLVFFREGRRILVRLPREPSRQRALCCASLAGVAGFLVAGLFEHNFGDGEVVMLVYALMALPFIVERESLGARAPTDS